LRRRRTGTSCPSGDPLEVDAKHCKVELENKHVRVLPAETHLPENLSDKPLLVEMKGGKAGAHAPLK
jgi:hypothetical protein